MSDSNRSVASGSASHAHAVQSGQAEAAVNSPLCEVPKVPNKEIPVVLHLSEDSAPDDTLTASSNNSVSSGGSSHEHRSKASSPGEAAADLEARKLEFLDVLPCEELKECYEEMGLPLDDSAVEKTLKAQYKDEYHFRRALFRDYLKSIRDAIKLGKSCFKEVGEEVKVGEEEKCLILSFENEDWRNVGLYVVLTMNCHKSDSNLVPDIAVALYELKTDKERREAAKKTTCHGRSNKVGVETGVRPLPEKVKFSDLAFVCFLSIIELKLLQKYTPAPFKVVYDDSIEKPDFKVYSPLAQVLLYALRLVWPGLCSCGLLRKEVPLSVIVGQRCEIQANRQLLFFRGGLIAPEICGGVFGFGIREFGLYDANQEDAMMRAIATCRDSFLFGFFAGLEAVKLLAASGNKPLCRPLSGLKLYLGVQPVVKTLNNPGGKLDNNKFIRKSSLYKIDEHDEDMEREAQVYPGNDDSESGGLSLTVRLENLNFGLNVKDGGLIVIDEVAMVKSGESFVKSEQSMVKSVASLVKGKESTIDGDLSQSMNLAADATAAINSSENLPQDLVEPGQLTVADIQLYPRKNMELNSWLEILGTRGTSTRHGQAVLATQGDLFAGKIAGKALKAMRTNTTGIVWFTDELEENKYYKVVVKVSCCAVHPMVVTPGSTWSALTHLATANLPKTLTENLQYVLLAVYKTPVGFITIMNDLRQGGYKELEIFRTDGEKPNYSLKELWPAVCDIVRDVFIPLALETIVHSDIRPGSNVTSNLLVKDLGNRQFKLRLVDLESLVLHTDASSKTDTDGRYLEINYTKNALGYVWWQCISIAYVWNYKIEQLELKKLRIMTLIRTLASKARKACNGANVLPAAQKELAGDQEVDYVCIDLETWLLIDEKIRLLLSDAQTDKTAPDIERLLRRIDQFFRYSYTSIADGFSKFEVKTMWKLLESNKN